MKSKIRIEKLFNDSKSVEMEKEQYLDFMVHSWFSSEENNALFIYVSGRTEDGRSVSVRIEGFHPYIYLEILSYAVMGSLRGIYSEICSRMGPEKRPVSCEIQKKRKLQRADIEGNFLKLEFRSVMSLNIFLREILPKLKVHFRVHEQNIDPIVKFTAIQKLDCSGWLRVFPSSKISDEDAQISGSADIHLCAQWDQVKFCEKDETIVVQNLIASFDIECESENINSKVPDPTKEGNRVFQISVVFMRHGEEDISKFEPYILSLYDCPEIPEDPERGKVTVLNFESEAALLKGFSELIFQRDPDILIGYNTHKFDWNYMITRAEMLGVSRRFLRMSRIDGLNCTLIEKNWESKASQKQIFKLPDIPGRFLLDLLVDIEKNYKMDSFSLDNVASSLLGLSKKDLSPRQIFVMAKIARQALQLRRKFRENFITDQAILEARKIVNSLIPSEDTIDDDGTLNILAEIRGPINDKNLPKEKIEEILGRAISVVGIYCVWDSYLPLLIMQKLNTLEGLRQLSNITCVPMNSLQLRGQQYKVLSQVYRAAIMEGYVVGNSMYERNQLKRYQGATVFHIQPGFYKNVGVNDFGSLYPSCMILLNVCWTTFVGEDNNLVDDSLCNVVEWDEHIGCEHDPNQKENLKKVKDIAKRNNDEKDMKSYILCGHKRYRFRKTTINEKTGEICGQGLLPRILAALLAKRRAVKKRMGIIALQLKMNSGKASSGDIERAKSSGIEPIEKGSLDIETEKKKRILVTVLDKLQLALKISANSAYGAIGSKTSYIPLVEGAASVTATGRKLIQETDVYIRKQFPGSIIVGGDTDSVFVQFESQDVAQSFKLCKEAARATTHHLKCVLLNVGDDEVLNGVKKLSYDNLPIDLEFENMYGSFIILTKKRYVATIVNERGDILSRQKKGVLTARRDSSRFARSVYQKVIDLALSDASEEEIQLRIIEECMALFCRQVSIKDLRIYKGIQDVNEYKSQTAPHVMLARKMAKRGTEVPTNTRLEYLVLWNGNSNALQGEKAEDYTYYRDNRLRLNLQIDFVYYVENQLAKPLQQVLDVVFPPLQTEYVDPELFIFGHISGLPLRMQDDVYEKYHRNIDRLRFLASECGEKAKTVKANAKYLEMEQECKKLLDLPLEKVQESSLLFEIFGHIYHLNPTDRKMILRERTKGNDHRFQIQAILENRDIFMANYGEESWVQDLIKYAILWESRRVLKARCKQFKVAAPKPHKNMKTNIISRNENFMKQIYSTHSQYREVVSQIRGFTRLFCAV